jgi:hypothetical protein
MRLLACSTGVAAVTLVACTGTSQIAPEPPSRTPSKPLVALTLPTSDWQPGTPAMTAAWTGDLVQDADGCVVLRNGPTVTRLVWPKGYSGRKTTTSIEIVDQHGVVVARTGQRVSIGGGGTPTPVAQPCANGSAGVWLVEALPPFTPITP